MRNKLTLDLYANSLNWNSSFLRLSSDIVSQIMIFCLRLYYSCCNVKKKHNLLPNDASDNVSKGSSVQMTKLILPAKKMK